MEKCEYAIVDDLCYCVRFDPEYDEVTISDHALIRYMSYKGTSDKPQRAKKTIRRMLVKSQKAQIKEEYALTQLLNHQDAANQQVGYRRYEEWILVLVGNRVVTIHKNEAKRWK
jgi:hypothetical protein